MGTEIIFVLLITKQKKREMNKIGRNGIFQLNEKNTIYYRSI